MTTIDDDPRLPVDRAEVFGQTERAIERIAPGFFPAGLEREHVARYRWAGRWVAGKTVLDVACGTGYGSALLQQAGARRVVAVDHHAPALAFAAARYPGPRHVRADALALPFARASFDMVVSLETVEHLSDPVGFVEGVRALLGTGGLAALSTPEPARSDGSNPYHLHEMSLPALEACLDGASFETLGRWGQFWEPPAGRLWRARGFGRLAHSVRRRADVWRLPARLRFTPRYWCVLARAR